MKTDEYVKVATVAVLHVLLAGMVPVAAQEIDFARERKADAHRLTFTEWQFDCSGAPSLKSKDTRVNPSCRCSILRLEYGSPSSKENSRKYTLTHGYSA